MNGVKNRILVHNTTWNLPFANYQNITAVGISLGSSFPDISVPLTTLHMGMDPIAGTGYRDWMKLGTLSTIYSDQCFFGIQHRVHNITKIEMMP